MPNPWAWVALANYTGTYNYSGYTLQEWSYSAAGVLFRLGVRAAYPNIPVTFQQDTPNSGISIRFDRFIANNTFNTSIFDVPEQCQSGLNYEPVDAPPTPARPNIPEDFEADGYFELDRAGTRITGEGHLASNQTTGKFAEQIQAQDPSSHNPINILNLERYDLGEAYHISSENATDCVTTALTGTMPAFWNWIQLATYLGSRPDQYYGLVDFWGYQAATTNITVGVSNGNVNAPVYLFRSISGQVENIEFHWFEATNPSAEYFNVPQICQN